MELFEEVLQLTARDPDAVLEQVVEDRLLEVGRRLIAVARVLRERLAQHVLDAGRDVVVATQLLADLDVADVDQRLEVGLAEEQALQGERLEQDDAQREDVGAPVDLGADDLLGRHVPELALEHAAGRVLAAVLVGALEVGACDAEVHDLHGAVVAHQDVRGRHVPMNDVEGPPLGVGGLVRVGEPLADLADDIEHQPGARLGPPPRAVGQDAKQIRAEHVLHRDVVLPVDLPQLVDLDDVGVLQRRAHLGFGDEHLDEGPVLRVGRQDLLDDEDLLEAIRPGDTRLVDLGHPARPDLVEEDVLAELCAGLEAHEKRSRW